MTTTEDADLVLEGLAILERDGFYQDGEMEGDITVGDLDYFDADAGETTAMRGTWPGKVRCCLGPRFVLLQAWQDN